MLFNFTPFPQILMEKFQRGQVVDFFSDASPQNFFLLLQLCFTAHQWVHADKKHVSIFVFTPERQSNPHVDCSAMICACFLMFMGVQAAGGLQMLQFVEKNYSLSRSIKQRPSQECYIDYFHLLFDIPMLPNTKRLRLFKISLHNLEDADTRALTLEIVTEGKTRYCGEGSGSPTNNNNSTTSSLGTSTNDSANTWLWDPSTVEASLALDMTVFGDFSVSLWQYSVVEDRPVKEYIFRCAFSTIFVHQQKHRIKLKDMDYGNNNPDLPHDFYAMLHFSDAPSKKGDDLYVNELQHHIEKSPMRSKILAAEAAQLQMSAEAAAEAERQQQKKKSTKSMAAMGAVPTIATRGGRHQSRDEDEEEENEEEHFEDYSEYVEAAQVSSGIVAGTVVEGAIHEVDAFGQIQTGTVVGSNASPPRHEVKRTTNLAEMRSPAPHQPMMANNSRDFDRRDSYIESPRRGRGGSDDFASAVSSAVSTPVENVCTSAPQAPLPPKGLPPPPGKKVPPPPPGAHVDPATDSPVGLPSAPKGLPPPPGKKAPPPPTDALPAPPQGLPPPPTGKAPPPPLSGGPKKVMGGPAPPPPPPGGKGGAPPPPPPPGKGGFKGPPKPVYTGPRLKYFLWKKTPRGGLWDGKPDAVARRFVQEKYLCEVFEVKEDAEKKAKEKALAAAAAAAEAEKSKKQKGFTITGQRLQNVGITLKKLRKSPEVVARALWSCDDDELDEDATDAILKIFPQPEEIVGLKNERKNENIDWSDAERFMYILAVTIPDAKDRISLWRASKEFASAVEAAESSVETLEKAASLLTSKSSRLSLTLKILLGIGNIMNRGSSHADAPGFRLENLSMLTLVKGVDAKTTLMEVLIRTIMEGERSLEGNHSAHLIGGTETTSNNNKNDGEFDASQTVKSSGEGSSASILAATHTSSSPLRAPSTEGFDNTLSQQTIEGLIKRGSLLQFPQDILLPLLEAGKCPLQGVSTQVTQLQHSLQKMRKIAADHEASLKNGQSKGPTDPEARAILAAGGQLPEDMLPRLVKSCADQFTQRVSALSLRHQSLKEDLASMVEFYGEDPNSTDEVAIFNQLVAFAKTFEEWVEKVKKQDLALQKEKEKELRQQSEQQSNPGSKPPTPVPALQPTIRKMRGIRGGAESSSDSDV